MVKKVVIADQLAAYVDPVLASYQIMSPGGAWAAALGYTFQLYYDFSGYSDMAVGLGHLFGIRIPQNFNHPYRALGIRDFWRRWHISLSTWLRDYLYINLGGNRGGPGRTNLNLLLTMLLGGLWHGANWTFVIWGFYHGVLLMADRLAEPWTVRLPALFRQIGTLLLVMAGWIIFRSSDLSMALVWLKKLAGRGTPATEGPPAALLLLLVLCGFATALLPESWDLVYKPSRRGAVVGAIALFAAYLFMNGRNSVFLYYQF